MEQVANWMVGGIIRREADGPTIYEFHVPS